MTARSLELQAGTAVTMGILNVTPDSFSDGGLFFEPRAAISQALRMADAGAEIIDVGGVSTRPPGAAYGEGAKSVGVEEELRRVIPVIEGIRVARPDLHISIDTYSARVADEAAKAGATIVNDVSAGTEDPSMFETVASLRLPMILMHGYGPQFRKASIEDYRYVDVVTKVFDYLAERIALARSAGVSQLIADVGIGFAKGANDNLKLLARHSEFQALGVKLLIGVSRKSTIGRVIGNKPPSERISGSVAAALIAVQRGASIVRTHDVSETVDAIKVLNAIESAA